MIYDGEGFIDGNHSALKRDNHQPSWPIAVSVSVVVNTITVSCTRRTPQRWRNCQCLCRRPRRAVRSGSVRQHTVCGPPDDSLHLRHDWNVIPLPRRLSDCHFDSLRVRMVRWLYRGLIGVSGCIITSSQ